MSDRSKLNRAVSVRVLCVSFFSLFLCLPQPNFSFAQNGAQPAAQYDRDLQAADASLTEAKALAKSGVKESTEAAIRKFREAQQIYHKLKNKTGEAAALNGIGRGRMSLGELPEAEKCFGQSLELYRSVGDKAEEARTLCNFGELYYFSGERPKAISYFTQALTLFRQTGMQKDEADALGNLGLLYHSQGENQTALDHLSQALTLSRTLNEPKIEAPVLNNIGLVYEAIGEIPKAMDCYAQALAIHRATGNQPEEAVTLNNLGYCHYALGEKRQAQDYYNQALLLHRASGRRNDEASTLNNLGLTWNDLGEKQKALDYYQQALTIFREMSNQAEQASTLTNIGVLYYSLDEKASAIEYLNRALSIARAAGDRAVEAETLNKTGAIFASAGEWQKAVDHYNQALPILRQTGEKRREAAVLHNLGIYQARTGDQRKAVDYLNQALTISQTIGNKTGEADDLNGIGLVYSIFGEWQKAIEYYQQADRLYQQISYRQNEADLLQRLAAANRELTNLSVARDQIEESLILTESLRAGVASLELRSSFLASVQDRYEFYIDLLMELHQKHPEQGDNLEALHANERARARGLLDLLAESQVDIRQGVDPALLQKERALQQRLNARAEAQTRLLSGKYVPDQATALAAEITELSTQLNDARTQIRQTSPHYAALTQPQPLNAAEIQKLLDEETLLLEFSLGEKNSYLWLVSPTSIISHRLPPRAEIEQAARKVYELLTVRQPQPGLTETQQLERVKSGEAEFPAQAAALSQMLLAPVASQLGNKRLVIVASGILEYLPFGALPVVGDRLSATGNQSPTADRRPLIANHEIIHLPSASILSVLRRETASRQATTKTIAVLADPVFAANDPRVAAIARISKTKTVIVPSTPATNTYQPATDLNRAVRSFNFAEQGDLSRLPFSREEAEAILSFSPSGKGLKALSFAANHTTAIGAELSQYRIVHFATHGLLNSEHPELSGLVFSLVDESGKAQNGFLRLHEIYNMRLPADLIVLSACQTALGKQIRGEGLVGLTRGFMHAGSPRVVASLWQVNDLATAELMKLFYRGMLKDGMRPAAALRSAQLEMMKQRRWSSPYFWAAFVLQGEWR